MARQTETSTVRVRRARRADIPAVATLMTELAGARMTVGAATKRFDLIANDPEQALFVASADHAVVGLLAFRIRHNLESLSHYGEVASLVVDARWRRRGVGHALMAHAESYARRRRCTGLWLVSGFGREKKAHRFYERLGFAKTGVRFVRHFDESD
jgi:ribosomal protein S18 acetylase RimI-like enzyme